jgi:hypothetical protein
VRETIRLGEGDNIYVVRQKLEQVRSGQVAVVVPSGHPALRSELSLVLLRRSAEALALDLVLVTADHELAGLARSLGLRTASSVDGVRAGPPVRRAKARPVGHGLAERMLGEAGGAAPQQQARPTGLRLPTLDDLRQQAALLVVGVAAVLVLFAGMALALPSATVVLEPKGERTSAEVQVVASTLLQQVDYAGGRVPARQMQIEVSAEQEGQTTGKRSIADQHAAGDVVFVNKTNGEVTVPRGTVLRTADGSMLRFYTLLDATVPGSYGATARVPVQAAEAGPGGNVPALTIRVVEGEPSYQVEVLNDKPIQGGSEKRVGIVAEADRDRLRASLVEQLQQRAYDDLVAGLSQGDWIPPDSLDVAIVDEVFDKQVDEEAETLRLTMKVRVTGVVVDGQATRALLAHAMQERGNGGLVINDATFQVQQPVGSVQLDGDVVRFTARGSALLVPAVNLNAVRSQIAGQEPEEAQSLLAEQCELSRPPEIRISPGWWPRLPWMPSRIDVQLSGGPG